MPTRELHPDLSDEEKRTLLETGIEVFNAGRFFDSHEFFEEIWRSTNPEPRDLYQGLVQVAAGMYHWTVRSKAAPAARMLERAVKRLEPFRSVATGVDVAGLLVVLEPWQIWLNEPEGAAPEMPTITARPAISRCVSRERDGS